MLEKNQALTASDLVLLEADDERRRPNRARNPEPRRKMLSDPAAGLQIVAFESVPGRRKEHRRPGGGGLVDDP